MAAEKPEKFTLAQKGLEFTLDLYKHTAAGSNENIFMSPLSISLALCMTLAGTKENTAKQMKDTLKLSSFDSDEAIHEAFEEIINSLLKSQSSAVKLHIANRMYVHNETKVQDAFKTILEKRYNTSSNEVDFAKEAEKIRLEINKWVEDQTQTKIKDLIAPGVLNDLTRLVLVNAIYFKGNWLKQFDSDNTIGDQFFLDGSKSVMADMMHMTSEFKFTEDAKNLNCKIIELPYVGEALSMFVLLPNEVNGLKKLEETLTADNLNEMMSRMRKTKVVLTLPKFKIEFSLLLREILSDMGMSDLFSADKADLSGITGKKDLFCSAVIHKAFLEVNEEGSEAAAATAVVITLRCAMSFNPEFRADHPFLLFIRDNQSGSIMFWGRIVNPNPGTEEVRDEL